MAIATRNGAYIGGQWIEGDGERIEVTSPGSGETVGAVTASSEAQVDAAVRAAAGAFGAWRATPILERVDLCRRAYTLCMERNEEIVPRSSYAETWLRSGDALEIVHFIGGG